MRKWMLIFLTLALLCMTIPAAFAAEDTWICPTCGRECKRNFCTNDRTPRPRESSKSVPASVTVGDIVTFGSYPQGANGEIAPVEWQVLDVQDGKALLISRYGLDCKPYNISEADVTWETCTLRSWLNGEFLNKAFREEEQKQIVLTSVLADKNPSFRTDPGNDTDDKIFLLSILEAKKYFKSGEERMCIPTEYVTAGDVVWEEVYQKDGKAICCWWLRSPGRVQSEAAAVFGYGDVLEGGGNVDFEFAVRPTLWVKIS